MSYIVTGCITYELFVLLCMDLGFGGRIPGVREHQWTFMLILTFLALELGVYSYAKGEGKTWILIDIVIAILFGVLTYIAWRNRNASQNKRWISLKSGEFKVELTETFVPNGVTNTSIGHNIVTQNEIIHCYSNVPEENLDVNVYVLEDAQGNLTCQFFEYGKNRPWTVSRVIYAAVTFLVCACALLVPLAYVNEYKPNGLLADNSLTGTMVVVSFCGTMILFFKNARQDLLYRILYYLSWFVFVLALPALLRFL